MNTSIDRRRLLRLLVALGASVAVNQKPAFGASQACGGPLLAKLDLAAIRELGRAYLSQRPDAAAVDGMAKLLADSPDEAATSAQLRTKVLSDFAAGRIVNLSGWFVSETEGCVFAALGRCD